MTYTPRTFNLPELKGLSAKQISVHTALYEAYVKHTNLIIEKIEKMHTDDAEGNAYVINELRRRLSFEFDGMRMHEYYFEQLEGGSVAHAAGSPLEDAAIERYGSWEKFMTHIREVAGTRGIGWVVVYFDPSGRTLHTSWVGDHELGQLSGLPIMLALDLWEHAFMVDYVPAEKKSYVEAFFDNLDWSSVERRFLDAVTS